MFSSPVCQPQVLEAVAHVVSTVRCGCSGILLPKGRQQRAASTQCRHEVLNKQHKQAVSQLDVEQCMEIILQPDNRHKLSAILGQPYRHQWSDSYVSAPTFFENKTGFTEQMLAQNSPKLYGVTIFLKPEVRRLLSQTLSPVYRQTRGFKRVSTRGTEDHNIEKSKALTNLLSGERPAVRTKILAAYMEGTPEKKPQSNKWDKLNTWGRKGIVFFVAVFFLYYLLFSPGNNKQDPMSRFMTGMKGTEVNPELVNVTFDDVRGCEEVKQELNDIVHFLKYPEKFQAMGAKLPKGVLMVGPPGVGKTLLAKAVAGEAQAPFFQISGSEFDEMFVGTGAKRVRQLFKEAKMKAPCVVFIDEIDSVGGKRTNSQLHPYANQTVNQLLSEMDGFTGSTGVIVIGATNKKDNLDKALLRPGRFDVEVNVMPPDLNGRKQLFDLYLSKVTHAKEIDLDRLASLTYGSTGADISNIVNQAAVLATLQKSKHVTMTHLDQAREKIQMGPAWKNRQISSKAKLNTAYHEAGHTLVAYYTETALTLDKVTILPRGGSLGHTAFRLDDETMYGKTKAQLLAEIDVALGGHLGELVIYGEDEVTTGASSDFQKATMVATVMVKKYGMSDKVGQRVYEDKTIDGVSDTSQSNLQIIDSEINRLLAEGKERAMNILTTHKKQHKALASALMEHETLSAEEIDTIMKGKTLKKKKPVVVKAPLKNVDKKNNIETPDNPKLLDKS